MQPVVALHEVCKSFGPRQVLHSLSLSVGPGEIVGLLGPNGSGKTTTLRLMAGFYAPDSGRITIRGRRPAPGRGNADIGYLPERAPLYDALTVTQYLEFVAGVKVAGGAAARRRAIEQAIDGFDLQGVARSIVGRLSKGQRQRVGLAQAVLNDPAVLLLDEATNGLDPVQIVEARAMIRRCAQGRAVVFSSHLMQEVEALCTRIAILRQGRLVEDAALGEAPAALQLSLALPQTRHAALRAALFACPGVKGVDAQVVDAMHSKWRIGWDGLAGGATCDAVLRIVLAHAELRAVLSMQDAVEARLLAALAPNDTLIRRRA
ncbi:ABC transporter ATP-binding protein [Achromobacter denitrificans]|uniref:ABC transporter ATP-binding protein n=1 Tax=Achromobacter denitrificans TaxID=32002 RepID=UPI000F686CD8|nr:ABC transporter ATP-binding protein [Achromobacter denitrificans]MDX3876889.1 ABC transporter ATP-binding protein [Achromobacter sp.]MBV2159625.1 ABC transporter ATP-binding protein [Achromobacter denitrificans]MDF3859934.1 ABC transporter ATP-binding protein [Achromobacter denitrificans]RSE89956.1 ABC transporter ATP-binding protein [Achromobacter denitrificans]WFC68975.1 ABC transporter ATP-binding protein [Achromobacter denitrificans]